MCECTTVTRVWGLQGQDIRARRVCVNWAQACCKNGQLSSPLAQGLQNQPVQQDGATGKTCCTAGRPVLDAQNTWWRRELTGMLSDLLKSLLHLITSTHRHIAHTYNKQTQTDQNSVMQALQSFKPVSNLSSFKNLLYSNQMYLPTDINLYWLGSYHPLLYTIVSLTTYTNTNTEGGRAGTKACTTVSFFMIVRIASEQTAITPWDATETLHNSPP